MPPETPIACQVCKPRPTLIFAGTVKLAQAGRIGVFNGKTHQTMGFTVPADFHGVSSSDGVIKNAAVARVPPGLWRGSRTARSAASTCRREFCC